MTGSEHGVGCQLTGLGVSAGLAIGPAVIVGPPQPAPADEPAVEDVAAAGARIAEALAAVGAELERRAAVVSGDAATVLSATAMMACDPALLDSAKTKLQLGFGVATSIQAAVAEFAAKFAAAGGYLAERATDLGDVGDRAVALLLGRPAPGMPLLSEPSVIVARDLAPAETALLDPALVLALVTELGGPTSHTSILAAQLGIPAVVHVAEALTLVSGDMVAVDGFAGTVISNPDADLQVEFSARAAARASLLSRRTGPGRLRDGTTVSLLANVGTVADAASAAAGDVEGVGLFRTEFLFGDRVSAPSLPEQIDSYLAVFQAFGSRPVTIRTLDAGADKPLRFAPQDAEANPALGVRGIRLSRLKVDLLQTQLQAIAIAAEKSGAQVKVMAPMVSTVEEASWFAGVARAVGLDCVGVMIEVPAAALRARHVLAEVDFASIGTNDLSQYVMAADRMNGALAALLDAWNPALLDLVATTVQGAGLADASISVCGEAAGDAALALVLAGLGVQSLSMAASKVAAVRVSLALHDLQTCQQLAAAARNAVGAAEAKAAVVALMHPEALALL